MDEVLSNYIYQPNLLLEIVLVLAIAFSLASPKVLTALIAGILLLRPNERFECYLPYTKLGLFMLFMILLTRCGRLRAIANIKDLKLLLGFAALIMAETLLFHREYFFGNILYLGGGLLLYLAVILFMDDESGMRAINYLAVFSCFLVCLEPVYYHYAEPPESALWKRFHWDGRLQAWGMWANANETAFMACLGIANLLILLVRYRGKWHFSLAATMIPFFMLVVFLTASRAGLVSMLLIFVPMAFFLKPKGVKAVIVLTCVVALTASYSLRPQRSDEQASSTERHDLRYEGRQMVKQHPLLGVGFRKAPELAGGHLLHNTYLQAFAETGVFGGILLVVYLYRVGKRLHLALKIPNRQGGNALVAVAGLYLCSLFYFYWGNQLLTVLFFLVMSQITCAINHSHESGDVPEAVVTEVGFYERN